MSKHARHLRDVMEQTMDTACRVQALTAVQKIIRLLVIPRIRRLIHTFTRNATHSRTHSKTICAGGQLNQ